MTFISGALIAGTAGKTVLHEPDEAVYVVGSYATILTRVVPIGKTWFLEQAHFSAPVTGTFRLKFGSDVKVVHHTNPAKLAFDLKTVNPLPIAAGEVLTVEFCARDNAFAGSAYSFIHGYEV